MLMGKGDVIVHYVIPQIIENQQDDDESEPKYKWVQCPDMPDGLLTVEDEAPHEGLKSAKKKGHSEYSEQGYEMRHKDNEEEEGE